MDMKLNKFIYEKLEEKQIRFLENETISEDDIENWICEWYMESFKEINTGRDGKPRMPPTWLAGPRWYDRRRRKIAEAKEEEDAQKLSKEI
jgi:hypothetical protein|tara:strand:- start:262 stop:534 length:273 start_codon:yes stop_codon:yes gene_type:complete